MFALTGETTLKEQVLQFWEDQSLLASKQCVECDSHYLRVPTAMFGSHGRDARATFS